MTALLVLVALIPKESIRDKTLESAEYLAEGELFGTVSEGVDASKIDRYADAILLNIAYHYDSKAPLRSVLLSAYYFSIFQEENENFLQSVDEDLPANQQYLRYWHGSIALVRPLLTVFNVKQIYVLNAVILLLLLALFIVVSLSRGLGVPAFAMVSGLVAAGCWFVPLSLEYTWTFMIMLAGSVVSVLLAVEKKSGKYATFFMLIGMVTSYMDFLTTETVTLLVPLLIIIWIESSDQGVDHRYMDKVSPDGDRKNYSVKGNVAETGTGGNDKKTEEEAKGSFLRAIRRSVGSQGRFKLPYLYEMSLRSAVSWAIGYVGMWALKWILTALVFKESTVPFVSEHIGERLSGDIVGLNVFSYLAGAVAKNIGCLFPLGFGSIGAVAGIFLLVFAAYIGFVYRGKDYDGKCILLFAITGLVPYVRYLVLHNHSFIHYFFTYRAQAATVMAAVFIIAELTGQRKQSRDK